MPSVRNVDIMRNNLRIYLKHEFLSSPKTGTAIKKAYVSGLDNPSVFRMLQVEEENLYMVKLAKENPSIPIFGSPKSKKLIIKAWKDAEGAKNELLNKFNQLYPKSGKIRERILDKMQKRFNSIAFG